MLVATADGEEGWVEMDEMFGHVAVREREMFGHVAVRERETSR
jgi:hypothetical protein